ncbi:MAG: hypothetical protein IH915_05915 [Thaumarchaeota archaeon]|nr:hypothetical protein [Nitrososphaerota archaeon]
MLTNSSIRKSVEEYIKLRLREIPLELENSFFKIKQIWKCENEIDFLYGYYVGKLEEGAIHYLLKAKRSSTDDFDSFEIRGIIETYRKQLYDIITKFLSK